MSDSPEHIGRPLEIRITSGRGGAPTALSAFDQALLDAGIGNFNLLYLSSVIPAGASLVRGRPNLCADTWGDRLYVVIAQQREAEVGTEAWAGIGWVQEASTGQGLFVEHHGQSQHFVETQIHESLRSMTNARAGDWGNVDFLSTGITCESEPVCALAAAVFKSEPWS